MNNNMKDSMPPGRTEDDRIWHRRFFAFISVVLACLGLAGGYAWHVTRRDAATQISPQHAGDSQAVVVQAGAQRAYILYRNTALGSGYGRVAIHYLDGQAPEPTMTPLACERVHFSGGRGVCLASRRGVPTSYYAQLFNDRFEVTHTLPLAGPPSRARMSPDGRYAAFTVFMSGHAYSNPGFTTRTSIVDADTGRAVVDDLESFQLLRDGSRIAAGDRNFWGVSFGPDRNRFIATVGTGGLVMLVEGDIASQRMRVIHDQVECPSWSPDGRRVAFKRRMAPDAAGRMPWRLHVLDLASGNETALLGETRNVDDQVEWLDNQEILYAMPDDAQPPTASTQLWALAVDGRGAPRRYLRFAFSPAVVNRGTLR